MWHELQSIIENNDQKKVVEFSRDVKSLFDHILDSKYQEADALCLSKFDNEMLFLSPGKAVAQASSTKCHTSHTWTASGSAFRTILKEEQN